MMLAKFSRLARPAAVRVPPPRLRFTTRAAAQQRGNGNRDLAVPGGSGYGIARRPLVNDLFFPAQVSNIFRDIEQELARAWGGEGLGHAATKAALGQVDIKETPEAFLFKMDTPGMTKKDISVKVTPDNVLVISGERAAEEESESGGFFRRERSYGRFSRSFQLPEKTVDTGAISARVEHGELTVTAKKRQPEPEPAAQEIQIE